MTMADRITSTSPMDRVVDGAAGARKGTATGGITELYAAAKALHQLGGLPVLPGMPRRIVCIR